MSFAALASVASSVLAQQATLADLADLSIEELANLEITSVSRRAERLADAAASVFVVTGDDIRRSGVTSLPEALRLAPNLQVARVDARQYAISARGFNGTVANKLLVLMDGRTVYTPLFSGVFWDAQDVFIEDVQRIEVISGPGATLWGANAVNGIINVSTRPAAETKGILAFAGTGNRESGIGARYGTDLGGGALRVYGKAFNRDNTVRATGADVADGWHNSQAGFRADWGTPASGFTLQGDAYRGTIEQLAPGDVRISGGNLLARWSRQFAAGDRLQVQAYFDHTDREIPGSFAERLDTFDVEFQHAFHAAERHFVTWGGGQRHSRDHVSNSPVLAFFPADAALSWTNLFVQDEIQLGDGLRFTAGAKIASNPYTGWELLPSARLTWKPDVKRTVWGAVSRAVRAPARLDRELFVPGRPPFFLAGGPGFRSEISNVFELGYRAQPSPRIAYSFTAFHSVHDHLRTLEAIGGGAFIIGNQMEGNTTGLETWGSFQAAKNWRLSAGALFLDQDLRFKLGSSDTNLAGAGNDAKRQLSLRSSLDLRGNQELDLMLRYVSRLPNPAVPSYTALDVRYALRLQRNLEISVTAQNLLERRHAEFGAAATRSEIERGVFFKLRYSL
ncbi:MAG: TonB-dependent receptor [Betaproteobacteria bacterium]|nr:MAG: TonB-dependent receptor [Betaproteobacteria bacterium]